MTDTTKLPKHKFWGAGEPDCPQELKAPNGELHTTRCKVCGDGWRKSGNVCLPLDPARVALTELVACKDLKDRAEAVSFAGPLSEHGENWKAEYDRMRAEYLRRQPLAWEAARSALGVTVVPPSPAMDPQRLRELADPSHAAFEEAMRQTFQMVDPFNPPPPGSYARGSHEGICAALKTMRENYDRAAASGVGAVPASPAMDPQRLREIAADARDAARYRWLRSDDIEVPQGQREIVVQRLRLPFREDQTDETLTESELDAAVDAARGVGGTQGDQRG